MLYIIFFILVYFSRRPKGMDNNKIPPPGDKHKEDYQQANFVDINNNQQKMDLEVQNICTNNYCCTGCLRCNNNICQICDFTKFKNINGLCVKLSTEELQNGQFQNCIQISPSGYCFKCNSGYYLDNNKKCQKNLNQIDNCVEFELIQDSVQCTLCARNYNLTQQNCVPIQSQNYIDNCGYYENYKCIKCNRGYIINIEGDKCVNTQQKNCLSYAYVDCQQCKQCNNGNCDQRYVQNPLGFVKDFFYSDSLKVFDTMFQINFAIKPKIMNHSFCLKLQDNCTKINEKLECIQCQYGYFLQNKQCIKYFFSSIENCLYDESQKCLICNTGYFLNDQYKCELPINNMDYAVENCVNYEINPVTKKKVCKKCLQQNSKNQYLYLKNNNCQVVERDILNCEFYQINQLTQQSECSKCSENYIISSNKKQCLQTIKNCDKVGFQCGSNILSVCDQNCNFCNIYCSQCESSYYLQMLTQECLPGSISNCEIYLQSIPENQQCTKCKNKYYLFDSKNCLEHIEIEKCEIYHPTKKNVCEKGYENYYTVLKDSECQLDPNINQDDYSYLQIQSENCYIPIYNLSMNDYQTCAVCKTNKIPFKYSNFTSCHKKQFISQKIDYCVHYQQTEDKKYICYECEQGYVLSEDYKSCIEILQCNKTVSIVLNLDRPFNFKGLSLCKIQDNNTCAIGHEIHTLTHHIFQCLECKPSYLKKINQTKRYAFDEAVEQYNDKDRYLINMGQYSHLNLQCVQGNIIDNCHFYNIDNTCMHCKIGYYLENNQCKVKQNACQKEAYIGYHAEYGSFQKCSCTNGQTSILKYQLKDFYELSFDLSKHNYQVNADCTDVKTNVDNCYLVIQFNIPHINLNVYMCGACRPGYRPIYFSNTSHIVKECIKIEFCQVSMSVNNCSFCQQNYGFLVKDQQIYGICYPTIENCHITDINKSCQMCNIGYYLVDNQCQNLDFTNCKGEGSLVSKMYYLKYNEILIPLVYQFKDYSFQGCLSCQQDFVAITKNQEGLICTSIGKQIKVIDQCLYLRLDQNNKYECYECNQGYTLHQNQCIQQTQNCKVLQSLSYCERCLEGLVSDQGVCVVPEIKNCKEQYNKVCSKCQQNYFLVNFQNNKQFCFRHEENCVDLVFDQTGLLPKIQCKQCNVLEKLTQKLPESKFFQIDPIDNCLEYQLSTYPSQSSIDCQTCIEGQIGSNNLYYIIDGLCKQRQIDPLCLNYEKYGDFCKPDGCQKESFFSVLSKKCTKISSIENCIEFSNFTTCKLCRKNYYLKECKFIDQSQQPDHFCFKFNLTNVCEEISKESKVQNCQIYNSDQHCTQCESTPNNNYFLQDVDGKKQCIESLAKNCKTQVSPLQCINCKSGYYIKKEQEILTCKLNDNPNCMFYSESFLEQKGNEALSGHCQYCSNNYAASNTSAKGNCIFLNSDQFLEHCIYYGIFDKKVVCLKCEQNHSLYQGECHHVQPLTLINDFCEANYVINNNATPQCIFCQMGYYLSQNNNITQCKSCESAGFPNCQICTVNDTTKRCELCQFEYYMNEEQACIKNYYITEVQFYFFQIISFLYQVNRIVKKIQQYYQKLKCTKINYKTKTIFSSCSF